MAYDEELAGRIREAVESVVGSPEGYREIKMFGGLCWTVNTHMTVGAGDGGLMVHVGKDGMQAALEQGARPATMGQRTMGGVVLLAGEDLPDDQSLADWVRPAVERAQARPRRTSHVGPAGGQYAGRGDDFCDPRVQQPLRDGAP